MTWFSKIGDHSEITHIWPSDILKDASLISLSNYVLLWSNVKEIICIPKAHTKLTTEEEDLEKKQGNGSQAELFKGYGEFIK